MSKPKKMGKTIKKTYSRKRLERERKEEIVRKEEAQIKQREKEESSKE